MGSIRQTMSKQDWNELNLVEDPAISVLQDRLGYVYVAPEKLEEERESPAVPVLTKRLAAKLKELNPWISDENVKRAVRALVHPQATNLMEANSKVYTHIVHGRSLEQDLGDGMGKRGQDVKFIDFKNPDNNEFLVTRQFYVRGPKDGIIPDIVCFVNGIPVVVIECKSPLIREPIEEGLTQLSRYQEAEDRFKGRGAVQLFYTVQILVSTCAEKARFGTILTPPKYYFAWNEPPHPLKLEDIQKDLGRMPKEQDVLFYGMLSRENLLDLIQNFVAFEIVRGRVVKKLARYQQYRAVNKAIDRIVSADTPHERGGIVWHTQGSGKSLSMLWTCVKLRRMKQFENPLIVVATDRINLDQQITGTFERCGFPNPEQASSVAELYGWLNSSVGRTILTTIQKFKDRSLTREVSNPAENVFVLVDEAHRTQYGNLAALMRKALPNACFLGFTGTPIDKRDRSTRRVFGEYLDTYTIEQAVKDGATVPILYEGRMAELHIEGNTLDQLFERAFRDYTKDQREKIKARHATKTAIAEAKERIKIIALDILRHFEERIQPNGFKAQVVACSREAAVRYKEALDELGGPESAVIISIEHNDPEHIAKYRLTREQEQIVIEDQFKDKAHPLAILIVCDKLLTGFDAPVEQIMYLDKGPIEHDLLQTIARVNRREDGKDFGLIVDYWGVSRDLQTALQVFEPKDVLGAMVPIIDMLPRLEMHHRAAMRFFDKTDKSNLEACLRVLEPEDVRAEFSRAFKKFSRSMDMLLPDPEALRFSADLGWLGKIHNAARNRYRDPALELVGCGEKAKALIEEHIRANGVTELLKPVSIFSAKFDEHVQNMTSTEAKASEMQHALRHEINVREDENPVFYKSLRQRLEEIIKEARQERIDAAEELKLLSELVAEVRHVKKTAQDRGFKDESAMALYELLVAPAHAADGKPVVKETGPAWSTTDKAKQDLAHRILEELKELAVIDWVHKDDVQRDMRQRIKQRLRPAGVDSEKLEALTAKILDLARIRLSS